MHFPSHRPSPRRQIILFEPPGGRSGRYTGQAVTHFDQVPSLASSVLDNLSGGPFQPHVVFRVPWGPSHCAPAQAINWCTILAPKTV